MKTLTANTFDTQEIANIKANLINNGWLLIRGKECDLYDFSALMQSLCSKLTFDPARQLSSKETQKVDAGKVAVGLHIENGNTPLPPDIVAFYSQKSAVIGSQTTVCDGALLWQSLPKHLKNIFNQQITVSRTLPEHLWKRYVATALSMSEDQVEDKHLTIFLKQVSNQAGQLNEMGELHYQLTINPVLNKNLSLKAAFANALLGPSFNYQKPKYTFADGSEVSEEVIAEVSELAERLTQEVQWQDNDIVIIDNKRVMHGRREIIGDLSERELFIGMGTI